MKRSVASALLLTLCLSACSPSHPQTGSGTTSSTGSSLPSIGTSSGISTFGSDVAYVAPAVSLNKQIATPFSTDEATNLNNLEKTYGFTLDAKEQQFLSTNKFLVKNILDTSIRPAVTDDNSRELVDLYKQVTGSNDYKTRTQANAVFLSSDLFFDTYNNVYTELLKEMENKIFFPSMLAVSTDFYKAASSHLASATSDADKRTWTEVRDYFAVPYAMLSTSQQPLTQQDYYTGSGGMLDPTQVQANFAAKDTTVDTEQNVDAFVKNLHLDSTNEQAVIADIHNIFAASGLHAPVVLKDDFDAYAKQEDVDFAIDDSLFTPRGTYTSSSLRREYFRALTWYIQVPFFVKSPQLTQDAFAVVQLFSQYPSDLKKYSQLESAINFLVGRSDDLMPVDYMQALQSAKGAQDQSTAIVKYLTEARDPMIKSMAAFYDSIGTQQSADVLLKTKGMRFFSGKFILDSYWTGQLTQGDEAPKPGYTQKLPPYASSLEVMALLGSDYARSKIPTLDFYTPSTSQAIDKAMNDLTAQEQTLDQNFWMSNIYNGWLWTIKGLFSWQKDNHLSLPQFMQSPLWDIKTLQTASAFWTELRHATILYAKQSFAELGGGGPQCDPRPIPQAPKGYIEPQPLAYARLLYTAQRTDSGLKEQGFELQNLSQLESFISVLQKAQQLANEELSDSTLAERTSVTQMTDDNGAPCTEHDIVSMTGATTVFSLQSDWEALRYEIVEGLAQSLPIPTEGPVLTAKDRRDALIADVHTGRDSRNPLQVVYEAVGVPQAIIVAVKDANGTRFDIGFTLSHYEFRQDDNGPRLIDEDWQQHFFTGTDTEDPYRYTNASSWPAQPSWYQPLVNVK